jgi:hypothetical protein
MLYIALLVAISLVVIAALALLIVFYYWGPNGPPKK